MSEEKLRLVSINGVFDHKNDSLQFWNSSERKIWVLCLFILTTALFAARVAMPVCASTMAIEFNWNKADLGAVMGSFFWGYVTTQILGGYIADRIGGDKMLWMSVYVWGFLTLLTPYLTYTKTMFVSTFVILTGIRILLGISQGVHYPSMMSLLGNKIPEKHRSLPSSVVTSAANFGSLVCGGIGSYLLEHYGWISVFYVIGLFSLLLATIVRLLSRKHQHRIISTKVKVNLQNKGKDNLVPWKLLLQKPPLWAIFACHFSCNNAFYIFLSWFPTYFHEHYPEENGWIYNVIPWLMSIPFNILGGWVSQHLINKNWSIIHTRKLVEAIGMIGSAFFAIVLPFCEHFVLALICAGMAASLQTFHNSAVLINPQEIAPDHAGSVFGAMNTFGAIPGFLGVYITGYILNSTGSWFLVFFALAATNILGLVAFLIWGSSDPII